MPKRLPRPGSTHDAVADAIRAGEGRNQIARSFGVSSGSVSKIAREYRLSFDDDWRTATATEAHRVDAALARLTREEELIGELLHLPQTTRQRDGKATKAYRRISYQLYDIHRHHA
ncbi:hypothetical protein [Agromyces sp. NPDC058126]|uniref:hypothetical protein n=1 Tax=Agromyces sp. NPDC058126 TaxID=3346350 RepID=UPI0036D9AD72